MSHDDLALLCHHCGLCCDGSLFGRVPLAATEVPAARRRRLHVVASGASFEQPCAALAPTGDGRRGCSMYAERPLACRRFECVLYDRHRREGGPLELRLAVVRRVYALIAEVQAARSTDEGGAGDDDEAPAPPAAEAGSPREELARILETDFARAPAAGGASSA